MGVPSARSRFEQKRVMGGGMIVRIAQECTRTHIGSSNHNNEGHKGSGWNGVEANKDLTNLGSSINTIMTAMWHRGHARH